MLWPPRTSIIKGTLLVDLAIVLGSTIVAVALRLPNYQLIPVFTDETEEIYRSLLAARGQLLPLTNVDAYIGSLWNWILAAAFWLSGFSLSAPRTVVLGFGALTVAATYPLAQTFGGRVAGLIAVALMSTAAVHVVVNSHVAYSNCITPFFTTIAVWSLYSAVSAFEPGENAPSSGRLVVLSGLFWGLALQTHPSVVAYLPGVMAFVLWKGRFLVRSRWLYLGVCLFVIANLNLLIYNALNGFGSLAYGSRIAASYTPREELSASTYSGRIGRLLLGFFETLGGAVDLRTGDSDFLLDPGLWPIALVSIVAVCWQWRRGNPLPVLLFASSAIALPLFNSNFEPVLRGRYLMPLLPVVFGTVGCLAARVVQHLSTGAHTRRSAKVGLSGVSLAVVALALHPLLYLTTYYQQVPAVGRTNGRVFQTLDLIRTNRPSGEVTIIDQQLQDMVLGPGAGRIESAFRLGLAIYDLPFRVADLDSATALVNVSERCRDQFLLLGSRRVMANDEAILKRLDLRDLDHRPAQLQNQASRYGLYRLDKLPGAPSC